MTTADTIAAIASGVGGAIAVIRLSGPDALAVAGRVWRGRGLGTLPRRLSLGRVVGPDGASEDQCLGVYMPGPHSYTAEDVVEFHCHGGSLAARAVLAAVLGAGARHADAGEFTRRAFVNGRLDLTEAEAVMDIIQAHSRMALHTANRQLDGVLRRRVEALHGAVLDILSEVEAHLDFVDEELDWEPVEVLDRRLAGVLGGIEELRQSRQDGEILRHGVRLVLAGMPNAGKSSVLNLLLGRDRAIVTAVPGTTRDTIEELAQIRGIPVHLTDTAGLRAAADAVEEAGIARSHASIAGAQLVLHILDATRPLDEQRLETGAGKDCIRVVNKADLVPEPAWWPAVAAPRVRLCATTGAGLDGLLDAVERAVWQRPHDGEPEVAVGARHGRLLDAARDHLEAARERLAEADDELAAVDLHAALDDLGRIVGRTAEADVLDRIFSRFCIGK